MTFLRYLKAMLLFARFQPWVNQPEWKVEDAAALTGFLATPAGAKFKETLLNLVLRQQASAINNPKGLKYNAGFAVGQRAMVAGITSMADEKQFTEQGETEADHATN